MADGFFVMDCADVQSDEYDYKGFMQDFQIADAFGKNAVHDTWKRAMSEWRDNVEYFTAFVMTLNHRMWMYYHNGDMERSTQYENLFMTAHQFALGHFKGDELSYYLRETD